MSTSLVHRVQGVAASLRNLKEEVDDFLISHAQGSHGTLNYDPLSDLGRYQAERLARFAPERADGVIVVCGSGRSHRETALLLRAEGTPAAEAARSWDEYPTGRVIAMFGRTKGGLDLKGGGSVPDSAQDVLDDALRSWIADGDKRCHPTWAKFGEAAHSALEELADRLGITDRDSSSARQEPSRRSPVGLSEGATRRSCD
jgi:hypothetical protein